MKKKNISDLYMYYNILFLIKKRIIILESLNHHSIKSRLMIMCGEWNLLDTIITFIEFLIFQESALSMVLGGQLL